MNPRKTAETPQKRIPEFKNDEEAAEFWDSNSLADYWHDTEPADDVHFALGPLRRVRERNAR
jgi:phage terminase large subunit-like protein